MLVLGLIVGSCATTTASVAIKQFKQDVCKIFQPLTWSTKDTDETIIGIKAHNRRQQNYCKGI